MRMLLEMKLLGNMHFPMGRGLNSRHGYQTMGKPICYPKIKAADNLQM